MPEFLCLTCKNPDAVKLGGHDGLLYLTGHHCKIHGDLEHAVFKCPDYKEDKNWGLWK